MPVTVGTDGTEENGKDGKKGGRSRLIKAAGTVITLLVIFFIVRRLLSFRIDYRSLFSGSNVLYIILYSLLFGLNMFVICIPWLTFLRIITGRRISFPDAAWIFNKSNMMKYLPGNVFQFVGRDEIALRYGLSHVDVSFATVCDVLLIVLADVILALLMYWRGVVRWVEKYGGRGLFSISVVAAVICAIFIIVYLKWKRKVRSYLAKLRKLFLNRKAALEVAGCLVFYLVLNTLVSVLYPLVLTHIVGIDVPEGSRIITMGAYLLSWVAGFIVPGAPGGIGIREATMTLLLDGVIPTDQALLGSVIFRFINVLGDFAGVFLSFFLIKLQKGNTHK
ncbi:MAG: hypothetical protein LKJ76_00575 [Lachnospiraceae bacterium]|jgi:uncharacterized membrane protein YbhN (UPF0104 family)|nr:hypothetical protein [Lachnospiraceae bacterium]